MHRTRASHMQIRRPGRAEASSFSNSKSATTTRERESKSSPRGGEDTIEHSRAHRRDAFTREKRTPVLSSTRYRRVSCTHTHTHTHTYTRVGRSYRKSQIPLTSLASYQGDGARLRYGFLYGLLGIYFFFTCDGYIFAIANHRR